MTSCQFSQWAWIVLGIVWVIDRLQMARFERICREDIKKEEEK